MRDGEMYVPVRSLAEALGAEVSFDPKELATSLTLEVGPRP